MTLLATSHRRFFWRHPLQLALAILGIAIGVAAAVAVDLSVSSARAAFQASLQSLLGSTTHHVLGLGGGIDESLYPRLRKEFPEVPMRPVVESLVEFDGELFRLTGIDLFAEASGDAGSPRYSGVAAVLPRLLLEPATVLMSKVSARRADVQPVRWLDLDVAGHQRTVQLIGTIEGDGAPRAGLEGVLMADIATVQEIADKLGLLDRVDLVLPQDGLLAARLKQRLPPGVQLVDAAGRNQSTARLSSAFETNLQAMSLLGLVVGLFLIYNTMSFSVLQRRELIGTLRLLGVTRGEILREIMGESLVLGILGSAVGLALGIGAAEFLVDRVTRTINDVYFVLTVKQLTISPAVLVEGLVLGLLTSLAGAWVPAREAAGIQPLNARARSHLEDHSRRMATRAALFGLLAVVLAFPVMFRFDPGLVRAIAGLFLVLAGCALMTPAVVGLIGRPLKRLGSYIFRLAVANVAESLSRTGVAVAALALAFAVALGVEVMTDSFRVTVEDWLSQLMQSDLYVSAHEQDAQGLDPRLLDTLRAVDGIAGTSAARRVAVQASVGEVELLAVEPADPEHPGYRVKGGDPAPAWSGFFSGGAVLVSEPFATRYRVRTGDSVRLATPRGWTEFPVAGVVYDYRSDRGIVLISRPLYLQHWADERLTSVGLVLAPGVDAEAVRKRVKPLLDDAGRVEMRSNGEIREASLAVFDRTFAVTGVLRLLAASVALVGLVGSLLSLHLERLREFATLRSLGLTPGQLTTVVLLQSGYIGLCAGALAVPIGMLLAWALVKVIQTLSFGWSIAMTVPDGALWHTPAVAVFASLLAGIYPAWRAARSTPLSALRDE